MGQPGQALGWDFACPDWEQRLREGRSLLPDLPLDEAEASRAVAMFNNLRLPDVPGQPLMANAAGEWARDIVRPIFGSMVAGQRQVREIFALVPKKNAKTTNGAGVGMTALLMNERPRADFVLVGPTQEIADTAFQQASGMIDADPYLKSRFHHQEHIKTISDRVLKSKLKIKTFDMKVATGSKPVMVLIDELHLMGSISFASRVIGQLRGGMIANPEAFLVFITTQSDQPPAGVFKAELDYARGVRDGRIKGGHMLPLLYEFPETMQVSPEKPWRDPANWPMVLPNLGRSITLPRLVEEYQAACEKGPEEERRWASQHLNVQIGLALHSDRWRGADFWEDAADREVCADLDRMLERCEVAVAGIDGGGLDDLFGLCVAGRERETKRWLFWCHGWVQETVLTLRKEIAPKLRDFAEQGDLTICADISDDISGVIEILQRVKDTGLFPKRGAVGVDPYQIGAVVDALEEIGLAPGEPDYQVVPVRQGTNLMSAMHSMVRKLADGTLAHAGAPIMAWNVANAKVEQRGNAVMVTKEAAGTAKIDLFVAALTATKLLEANPEAADSRGAESLLASLRPMAA